MRSVTRTSKRRRLWALCVAVPCAFALANYWLAGAALERALDHFAQAYGCRLRVGRIRSPLPGRFRISGLELRSRTRALRFEAPALRLKLALGALLGGKLVADELEARADRLTLGRYTLSGAIRIEARSLHIAADRIRGRLSSTLNRVELRGDAALGLGRWSGGAEWLVDAGPRERRGLDWLSPGSHARLVCSALTLSRSGAALSVPEGATLALGISDERRLRARLEARALGISAGARSLVLHGLELEFAGAPRTAARHGRLWLRGARATLQAAGSRAAAMSSGSVTLERLKFGPFELRLGSGTLALRDASLRDGTGSPAGPAFAFQGDVSLEQAAFGGDDPPRASGRLTLRGPDAALLLVLAHSDPALELALSGLRGQPFELSARFAASPRGCVLRDIAAQSSTLTLRGGLQGRHGVTRAALLVQRGRGSIGVLLDRARVRTRLAADAEWLERELSQMQRARPGGESDSE